MTAEVVAAIEATLGSGQTAALREVLTERVRWGDCLGPDAVVATMRSMFAAGAQVQSWVCEEHPDRVTVAITASLGDGSPDVEFHQALLVENGLVTAIVDASTADEARVVAAPESVGAPGSASSFNSLAAVFPCRSVEAALLHYDQLGFSTHRYDGGADYGYAERGGVALHLAQVDGLDPLTNTSAVYLFVGDADAVHAEWINSGAVGRFTRPEPTPYGLREGAHVDPDGNLLRYGSRSE